jgi:SsrA-binding protein
MNAKVAAKSKSAGTRGGEKVVTVNRRAWHDYHIEEQVEAGIVLTGTEIKSIRDGRVNIREAHARLERGEIWLYGMHISPYGQAGDYFQHEPGRPRKLLLHRTQIASLGQRVEARGYTLVPLRLVLRNGRAKIDIGLAKGKHAYDKRDAMAERDSRREIEQALRRRD